MELTRREFAGLLVTIGAAGAVASITGCSGSGSSAAGSTSTASASASTIVGTLSADGTERTLTDDAGRTVTVPAEIDKIYCAIPTSEAMAVTLAPEKLVGWVNQPSDAMLKYLPASMASLPVLGGWMGQQVTANMEAIINANPDVILYSYGSNSTDTDVSTYAQYADQIASDSGKPCIVFDGNLNKLADNYRWLGQVIGVQERSEKLAAYVEEKLAAVAEAVAKVPASEIVTCYYAEGQGGLATDQSGSTHTQVIDFCNVKNVAVVDGFAGAKGQGMIEVSMESVIGWNPQVILVSGSTPANYASIKDGDSWKDIQAVKDGKIYQTPIIPFGWFDRPPNATRVLGCQWFAGLIYPKYYTADVREDIKDYFDLFYNVNITDAEIDTILSPNPVLA